MKTRSSRLSSPAVASAVTAIAALALAGCGSDPADPGPGGSDDLPPISEEGSPTIKATDTYQFVQDITIATAGVPVRWLNDSGLRHTVTPVGHEEWEKVESNQRGWVMLEHTFETPGEYLFRCDWHDQVGMVGKVIVTPAPQ